MNEAQRRGYKKVRITQHVGGWPVGSIVWHDGEREAYNDDCSTSWCHKVGVSCEYVEDEKMKIEAGKYYKTRDGRVVGPMVKMPEGTCFGKEYVWSYDWRGNATPPERLFCESGKYWDTGTYSEFDLISPAYPEQGTLKEIGAQVGDVVEWPGVCQYDIMQDGSVLSIPGRTKLTDGIKYHGRHFRIISRASDKPTSPVRTVTTTRMEIVPGVYGRISIHKNAHDDGRVLVRLADSAGEVNLENCGHYMTSEELTAAISTLTEIRDALT